MLGNEVGFIQRLSKFSVQNKNNTIVLIHSLTKVQIYKKMRARSQTHISDPKTPTPLSPFHKDSLPSVVSHLKPKHLSVTIKKITSLDKIQYKEPIADRIRREKEKALRPLTDLEVLLKKFDEVAHTEKSATATPRPNPKLQQKFQSDLDKRIKQLLSLPTVKNISTKLQKQRQAYKLEPQTATTALLGQGIRLSILNKYDQYIKKAVKPTYRRLRTDYV